LQPFGKLTLRGLEVAMNGREIKTSWIAVMLVFGLAQADAAFAAERITGTVVDPGGTTGRSATVPFSIYIYDYSTDQEIERLAGVLSLAVRI
jgi:hypothetical protein